MGFRWHQPSTDAAARRGRFDTDHARLHGFDAARSSAVSTRHVLVIVARAIHRAAGGVGVGVRADLIVLRAYRDGSIVESPEQSDTRPNQHTTYTIAGVKYSSRARRNSGCGSHSRALRSVANELPGDSSLGSGDLAMG